MTATLRKFQTEIKAVAKRIAQGEPITDILAHITQGGGKSSIAALLASELPDYKICWLVPRDSLRRQAVTGFEDIKMKMFFGNTGRLREIGNASEGGSYSRRERGYVTTYQAICQAHAKDPDAHAKELRNDKYILILDENYHVALNSDPSDEEAAYHAATLAMVAAAKVRVYAGGSMERHDKRQIAYIPYTADGYVDYSPQPGWAKIRYTRADALREGAIHELTMHLIDCETIWQDTAGEIHEVRSLRDASSADRSAALNTALTTDAAHAFLDLTVAHWREYKANYYGAAKLLVIAPSIKVAKEYQTYLNSRYHNLAARIAVSKSKEELGLPVSANSSILHFKGEYKPECDVLVTVAIAYEGLDVPQITHIALCTNIRSLPWIEQANSRANRVEGTGQKIGGHIFCPNDHELIELIRSGDMPPRMLEAKETKDPASATGERQAIRPISSRMTHEMQITIDGSIHIKPEEMAGFMRDLNASGLGAEPLPEIKMYRGGFAGAYSPDTQPLYPKTINEQEAELRKSLNSAIVGKAKGDTYRKIRYNNRIAEKYGPRRLMSTAQLERAINDVLHDFRADPVAA